MTNKLTKDQAVLMIEEFSKAHKSNDWNGGLFIGDTIKIINQCTEKEFPHINMHWNRFGIDEALYIQQLGDFPYDILLETRNMSTYFNKEQFKQFTEGCNKIVEWINEQANT